MGKCPLIYGHQHDIRLFIDQLAQTLFTSVHIINCHSRLTNSVISSIVSSALMESIIIVMENIENLSNTVANYLAITIDEMKSKSNRK